MRHSDIALFFFQISALLAVAIVSGHAARALRMPAVLGEIVGGVLLGPSLLGGLAPEFLARAFPLDGPTSAWRESFLHLGMVFFLLAAGLEVDIRHLPERGRRVALTAGLAWLTSLLCGVGLVQAWPSLWGAPLLARPSLFALFIGTALAITALPVIARILLDLKELHSEIGRLILTSAALCDLGAWMVLGFILAELRPGVDPSWHLVQMVVFTASLLAAGRWLGEPLFAWARRHLAWPTGFIGLVAVLALLAGGSAEALGLHAAFGAFLFGVAVAGDLRFDGSEQARDVLHQFALSFFAPLYFVSIGLKTDFRAHFDGELAVTLTLAAVLAKTIGGWSGARLGGMANRPALAAGFGLNGGGAMAIIVASAALEVGLIDVRIFAALVFMALATSLISAVALRRILKA